MNRINIKHIVWCPDLISKIHFFFFRKVEALKMEQSCRVTGSKKKREIFFANFLYAKSLQQIICHVCVVAALCMYDIVRALIFLTSLSSF